MARLARGEYLDPQSIQIFHAVHRCVRRAFLCGDDPVTGQDYEYRRQWIRDRLEFLASVFAIDCLTFAVMSNHVHLVLRSRPDVVRGWTDQQVVVRWLRLFPHRRTASGQPAEPTEAELNSLLNDPRKLAELRCRLSDISWWMRCTAENIARRANREDKVTGHFWEGRYKAQLLLDEASLLACSMYVDLNPVRAAMADRPVQSPFTGAYERLKDVKSSKQMRIARTTKANSTNNNPIKSKAARTSPSRSKRWERSRRRVHCGWLSPVEIDERSDPVGADASGCGRRASLKGFLSIPLNCYLELLDWTGRQLMSGKRGHIPSHLRPILQRFGITTDSWCTMVRKFGSLFKRAAGRPEAMLNEANRRGQSYMQAPGSNLFESP